MSAASITLAGRAAALKIMVDTCTITRKTGTATDLQTGVVSSTTETIYAGRCRVQQHGRLSRPTTVAEAYVFQTAYELQLPMTAVDIAINDVVVVNTSVLDPDLTGRNYWVRELAAKTHGTSRRIGIEEVGG